MNASGRRPPTTMRSVLAALLLAAVAAGWTQSGIAELEVTAYGRQSIDLATGRTVLEDGGELIERRSGVRLVAAWIAYAEGIEVVARDVAISGDVGLVEAPLAVIDLVASRLTASGGVAWRREGLQVTGETLWFDADAGVVGLLGGVEAVEPVASAAEVWIELDGGRVLLVGPYAYTDGPLALRGGDGAGLQLEASATEHGVTYDASTAVDAEWSAAVAAARSAWEATSEE
ncbi:MAG: hypothetical protein K0A98_13320 [Trueperaceae bacterium]|nr:hypothetical protein [Trueperaceae bacterium]